MNSAACTRNFLPWIRCFFTASPEAIPDSWTTSLRIFLSKKIWNNYFSGKKQYASSVITKTRVTLAELELDTFQQWFDQDKTFRDYVVSHIARKAYKMAGRIGLAKYEDARYRLIKTLLDNVPENSDRDGVLMLNYTHFELAFMTGMSERSVNRVLQKLKEEGLVALKRKKILIKRRDLPALAELLRERD